MEHGLYMLDGRGVYYLNGDYIEVQKDDYIVPNAVKGSKNLGKGRGMLGVPLLAIASSVVLVGEPVTWPLLFGTALVIAGIAIVILDRNN